MRWIEGNKGSVLIVVVVILSTIFMGVFLKNYPVEAILGGAGNVTTYDNPHNLSAGSSGISATTETQICIFCHTPHHAITEGSLINAPLWNHRLSSASYTVTPIPGLNGTQVTEPANPPDGASKLCLSCHDGTVGIGELATGDVTMAANPCLDSFGRLIYDPDNCPDLGKVGSLTDLRSKHLVSIPVNQYVIYNDLSMCQTQGGNADKRVVYPWNLENGTSVFLRPTAQTIDYGSGPLPGISGEDATASGAPPAFYKTGYNYGVQCSSCHDPHFWAAGDVYNVAGAKFIVKKFNDLCNACHTSENCKVP